MKTTQTILLTVALACGVMAQHAEAQRGMGQPGGVARQAELPKVVTLSGTLQEIKTGPCEHTTGKSPIGTHLLLKTRQGDVLNIHLGPQAAVADTVSKLSPAMELTVQAFRTDLMPQNHYTAQSLAWGTTTVALRDAGLRPQWAGPGAVRGRATARPADADRQTLAPAPPSMPGGGRRGGPPWAGAGPWQGGRRQGGPWQGGPWQGGRGPDAMFPADREIFHSLLEDHRQVRRTVTRRPDGVETLTESEDPNVALAIQGHVAAMHERVTKNLPLHLRDPLFAAVFGSAARIKMQITKTDQGVRVVETSDDPYVVKLIQAHAEVVSKFVAEGFPEARQNHPVPGK